ncbi:hypothetical protein CA850_10540 [Micromonospora echinospora]|nr:hypothetical protein CA850_10540 [Micromonospora echinospora]
MRRAIQLYEQALTRCRRVLGNDHPQTRAVYDNLQAAIKDSDSR